MSVVSLYTQLQAAKSEEDVKDAYIKALEVADVNYAILAAPPGFRVPHFKACVEHGKHVFMEKPVATDAPGIRDVIEASNAAKATSAAAGSRAR